MSQISTISEFLLHAGTDYRVFDMGRGIRKLSSQAFLDIENGAKPAAYPRQQHIWLGLVFWNRQLSEQHYIWFIKLPLDEQSKLVAAARNQFLQIIIDALGQQLENTEQNNGQLPENPYTFVPMQQQLADFNSISRQQLKLGHSAHYQTALDYIRQPQTSDWHLVPLQGIADFASSISNNEQQTLLLNQFATLAPQVTNALMVSLENQPISVKITERLVELIQQPETDPQFHLNALRALSQSPSKGLVKLAIKTALASPPNNDVLMIIAGRLWQHLADDSLLRLYLEAVAQAEPAALFSGLFSDLVQIPAIRHSVLQSLRWPDKSAALTQAVGRLFDQQAQ